MNKTCQKCTQDCKQEFELDNCPKFTGHRMDEKPKKGKDGKSGLLDYIKEHSL